MEDYIFDDKKTPKYLKISDDNNISLYSYIYICQKDHIYKRKIRKTTMENLKIKHYLKIGETCSICFDEIMSKKDAYLTDCGHSFHLKCIIDYDYKNSFLKNGVFCPICRQDMGNYNNLKDSYTETTINTTAELFDFEDNIKTKLPKICYDFNNYAYNMHFHRMNYEDCKYCRL
jgi:hypothetical protein